MPRHVFRPPPRIWRKPFSVPSLPYANSGNFETASEALSRGADLTGNADGKLGSVSFWIIPTAQTTLIWESQGQHVRLLMSSSQLNVILENAAGSTVLAMRTTTALNAGQLYHFSASWDLGNGVAHIYVDDSEDKTQTTLVDDDIDYTATDQHVSSARAVLSEYYLNFAEYLDLSEEANRRKFVSTTLIPIDLGADGSNPTGTAPIVYFKFPSSNKGLNSGTGGNFSVSGTITGDGRTPGIISPPAGNVAVALTGVLGTGAVGSLAITGDANVTPTGVVATGQIGSLAVAISIAVTPTGVEATGFPGTPTVTGDANVTPTGVAGTGQIGALAIGIGVDTILSGVSATGGVGTLGVVGDANVTPTGVAGTGQVGGVSVTAGGDVSITLSGVAATGQIGAVAIAGDANVEPGGVAAIAQLGDLTISGTSGVTLTGVSATGQVGTVTVVLPSGEEGKGARRVTVEQDDRTITIKADDRTVIIARDARTVTIN